MLYKFLADTVVLVHFLWVVFLIFGALLGARYRAVRRFHVVGLVFALILNVFGWYCPLTHIENWARSRHDPFLAYTGSFIIHYVEELIYVSLSRSTLLLLTFLLCGFNAWYYLRKRVVWKERRP